MISYIYILRIELGFGMVKRSIKAITGCIYVKHIVEIRFSYCAVYTEIKLKKNNIYVR